MQVLPFVQVRDLAPSASFYSAVTQPLGLRYLSASPTNIVFGDASSGSPEPVFEVKKSSGPPRPARLVLSAHSTSVVSAFHAAALRAHPDLKKILPSTPTGGDGSTEIPDFDGNVMEVVYVNPPDYPSDYAGSTVRRTQSTPQEVSRILDWNLDVATSAPSRAVTTARSSAPSSRTVAVRGGGGEEPYSQLKRSMTTSSVDSPSAREREREREREAARSNGGGGMTFGSVLAGVAAGALVGGALTYTVLRKDRDRAPQTQVYEMPAMPRRSTYHPDQSSRQIEVERAIVDKTQYPETTATSKKYPPSAYGSRYSQAGLPKSKTLDDFDDRASRHYNGNGSRARTRSVSEATRRPLMIADVEHRSNAGGPTTSSSRHAEAPIPPPAPVPPKSEAASTKLLLDAASGDARSQVSAASSIMPPHLHKFYPEASYRAHKNLTKQAIAASAMRKPREPVRAPSPPRAPSVYAHGAAAAAAAPADDEYEYRSQAASATRRRGAPREPSRTRARHGHGHGHSYREPDAETYVSAAARSAASTVRAPPGESSSGKQSKRSGGGGGSRYSVATGTTTPRSEARPRHSSRSVVWDEDDDRVSVAPSDSISCIGDKQDRRRAYY